VLENGIIVGHGTADQLKSDPAVQRAYLGGAASATTPPSS
jgi:branched-chain amino acid transport system ATP-binding protein